MRDAARPEQTLERVESPGSLRSLVRREILELEPYHSARETVQEGILLDANENPYPRESPWGLLNRYPDPNQRELRGVLSEYVGVGPEYLLAGAGSDEVLDWIFKVFCQGGVDQVGIVEPTYGMYRVLAAIYGVEVVEYRLNRRFQLEADAILGVQSPRLKVLFLCSPNNPTGNLLDREQILKLVREGKWVVVVDEAYWEFSGAPSLVPEVRRYPHLVVLRTFSKAFAGAALRLGYAVADPWIVRCFLKVKAPYNLGTLVQRQGIELLRSHRESGRQLEQIRRERERIRHTLLGLQGVQEVFPSDANFLLFRCLAASEICRRLLQKGIVVRDRSRLPGLQDCIRLSIGTPEENDVFLREFQRELEARSK